MNHVRAIWGTVVVGIFAIPLLLGLGRWDMRSDEAIYSYAVERILETGDWLTPRNIPTDTPFLEKPPLKFWLVAGGMSAGLLPVDETGMRLLDALFGVAAFAYIFAFGLRLAGPVAGIAALFVLLAFNPLVFEHGLRSNNMEAALFLSYCGGLFHFLRWRDPSATRRRAHAAAVGLYFALGFLTKFVAVAFLPLVALAWLVCSRAGRQHLVGHWKDWLLPTAICVVLIAPWFVYEWAQYRDEFWTIIFGAHVYTRFTASLDPSHVHPWHYYFTQTWHELFLGHVTLIVKAGVGLLAWEAWKGTSLARLLLLWWLLPTTLISFGTSKLLHYAYPFFPPLALGAGLVVARLAGIATRAAARVDWQALAPRPLTRPLASRLLLIVAVACIALAAWSVVSGEPARLYWGDVLIFRSGSIGRPLLVALILLIVTNRVSRYVSVIIASAIIALCAPVDAYSRATTIALRYDRPMSAITHCLLRLQDRGTLTRSGMFIADWTIVTHPPYYYFRHLGPWQAGDDDWLPTLVARMEQEAPAIVGTREAPRVLAALTAAGIPPPSTMELEPGVLLLLPGTYARCTQTGLSYGGAPFEWTSVTH